jgi:very-short-patch-repair endonuclease
VKEGYQEAEVNRVEVERIVNKIVEICEDEKYAEKTIGVITLLGKFQATEIETLLRDRLHQSEIEARKIICGEPYQFQGDERDVILLSMVAANNERTRAFVKESEKQRLNVAMSRAKEQVILFHSVRSSDLGHNCIRRQLIDFFNKQKTGTSDGTTSNAASELRRDWENWERIAHESSRNIEKPPRPYESWFELDVALEIMRKGYAITPQYEIIGKRIDLVVEGGQSRLAVECDGDYWHGPEKYEEDMHRQRQLERCGWEFFRIRSSSFCLNKEKSLAKLWDLLERRNIFPLRDVLTQESIEKVSVAAAR